MTRIRHGRWPVRWVPSLAWCGIMPCRQHWCGGRDEARLESGSREVNRGRRSVTSSASDMARDNVAETAVAANAVTRLTGNVSSEAGRTGQRAAEVLSATTELNG